MTALLVQLPAFLSSLARGGTRLADGLWVLRSWPDPDTLERLEHVASDLVAVDAEVALCAEPAVDAARIAATLDDAPVEVVAVSRGLRPVAAALTARLEARSVALEAGAARCVVVARGVARVGHLHLAWQRDRLNRAAARQLREPDVSRAGVKWLQTEPLLTAMGLAPCHVKHWLELGAAPGGITARLAGAAHRPRVTALDRVALAPRVAGLDRVEPVVADAAGWTPPGGVRYGGLVCDLNGPPQGALEAVARLSRWLSPGAPIVVTLKRPGWHALEETPDVLASGALAPAGIEVVRWQHLHAHRPAETVIVGRVVRPTGIWT